MKVKNISANRAVILKLAKKYSANIISDNDDAMIIEQAGTTEQLDEFEEIIRKYGIIEMVRSGKLVMAKGRETT